MADWHHAVPSPYSPWRAARWEPATGGPSRRWPDGFGSTRRRKYGETSLWSAVWRPDGSRDATRPDSETPIQTQHPTDHHDEQE